jgi:DNA-binding transcriptional ArsR family regulator
MSVHTRTELVLDTAARLKAVANDDRARILRILGDGPASSKELANLTGMSHGKVGHHVKVLREAGFIQVVEERPVRAVVERFYGLAYDRLRFAYAGANRLQFALDQAAREAAEDQPFDPPGVFLTARIDREQAQEFHERLLELAEEFASHEERTSPLVFGFAGSVFLTETPSRESR